MTNDNAGPEKNKNYKPRKHSKFDNAWWVFLWVVLIAFIVAAVLTQH